MMARLTLVQDDVTTADIAGDTGSPDRSALIADGCRRLARALESEGKAILDLRQALQRQRAAVAADDAAGLEQSADHVGRAVSTLGEARRNRGDIMQALTGRADATFPQLERSLGRPLPDALQAARAAVTVAARGAASDVAINQHVLRRALDAGDLFLQRLFSSMTDPMPVYTPAAGGQPRETRSLLINRRA
jgi:hypothetical protein